MKKITIAIDGFSSCGKSTLAKELAFKLGYSYVDTGAMYRAVTLYLMREGIISESGEFVYQIKDFLNKIKIEFGYSEKQGVSEVFLNGECVEDEIRGMKVSGNVSNVSAVKEVRLMLVEQQKMLGNDKGVVMDGRDIGTVVFPDAEVKLFMIADTKIRAQRRFDELRSKGQEINLEKIQQNLEERDHIDTHREESPLVQAEDAIIIDNSKLNRDEQLNYAVHLAESAIFELNNADLID